MKFPNIINMGNSKLPVTEYVVLAAESDEKPDVVEALKFAVPKGERLDSFLDSANEHADKIIKGLAEVKSKFKYIGIYKLQVTARYIKDCSV